MKKKYSFLLDNDSIEIVIFLNISFRRILAIYKEIGKS